MTGDPLPISLTTVRRLAVMKQHLAGGSRQGMRSGDLLTVLRDIVYVQMDSFSTAAPTHILALGNRVDGFRPTDLDQILWREKRFFETPPEPASIALTEDYPLYYSIMRRDPEPSSTWWGGKRARARAWLAAHEDLRDSVMRQLEGAELTLDQFEEHVPTGHRIDGWTSGSEVSLTLTYLHGLGEVMVVGREGMQKVWGLPGDFLPAWVDRTELPEGDLERLCAQRAIRSLGTATRSDVNYYFPRGKYLDLKGTLLALEAEGKIHRVRIEGMGEGEARFIHEEDLGLLDGLGSGSWKPRLSILGPFDNLISGRERTRKLFGFDYVHGNYLPKEKRKYGVYVLPILWGDRLIGRLDPRMDRRTGRLVIDSIHAEPDPPADRTVGKELARAVDRLASLSGANEVVYPSKVPAAWRSGLGAP